MFNRVQISDQQIDEAVTIAKIIFLPKAKNSQEADDIKRNIESAGDKLKFLTSISYEANLPKTLFYAILSQIR